MKDEIRNKLKIKRKFFEGVRREYADRCILENFLAAFGKYDSFLLYSSFGTEADTSLLISALLNAGKKVFLPRVEGENIVAVPYGQTVKGAFGIKEPVGQAYDGDIDVTVIPLLAVNSRGFRIGYGKGFYDRYLNRVQTQKVGLGYDFQIEEFDEDEWDIPLGYYVSEKGIYGFGK